MLGIWRIESENRDKGGIITKDAFIHIKNCLIGKYLTIQNNLLTLTSDFG